LYLWAGKICHFLSRLNRPIRSLQIFNFAEAPIPGNEDHPVAFRCGSNPNIVLGKRPPLLLQALFQTSVLAGNIEIAGNNGSAGRKSLHLGGFSDERLDFAAPKNNRRAQPLE
jgi:hypothetical protein